jgi:glycosyltransferase involved in cell wall biosynthesis
LGKAYQHGLRPGNGLVERGVMPKVSIIVPVYNAQETLRRCVDSILGQEFRDFELILADDGSIDGSPALCDEYAEKDNRVRVLHKENSGVSDTRNKALDAACGDYVQFLDSDDWIAPEATRLLVRAIEENDCDMVIADFYRVIGSKVSRKGDIDAEGVLSREEFGDYMIQNPSDFYFGVVWNKLYRRDIIEKYQLRMDVTLSWCEDFIFNMEYELHCKRIYPLQVPIYYYVRTRGSLASQGANPAKVVQMKLNVIEYYNDFYKQVFDEEDYKARRPDIYRFYIESAGDGDIMPWQRSAKLGEERVPVYVNPEMEDDALLALYLEGKLVERNLELVAARFDLTPRDVRLLDFVRLGTVFSGREELADYCGLSALQLARTLQRLQSKRLITVETRVGRTEASDEAPAVTGTTAGATALSGTTKTKLLVVTPTEQAQPVMEAIAQALRDCDRVRCSSMSEDEANHYRSDRKKALESIRSTLT